MTINNFPRIGPGEAPKNARNTADVRRDVLSEQRAKWLELKKKIQTSSNEKLKADYEKIHEEAMKLLQGPASKEDMQELATLYKDAIQIRAGMFQETLTTAMELESGKPIDENPVLMTPIDALRDTAGIEEIGKELSSMVLGLAMNPGDIQGGQVAGNRYWMKGGEGIPMVDLTRVSKDQSYLQRLRESQAGNAALMQSVRKISQGLETLRTVDPVQTAYFDWDKKYVTKMDTRPLRILGILGTGLMSAIAIGFSLKNKELPNKYGLAYMLGFAYLAKPNMFQGKEKAQIETLLRFEKPENKTRLKKWSVDGFEELQGAVKTRSKQMQALRKKHEDGFRLTATDIAEIADKNSALEKTLITILGKGSAEEQLEMMRVIDLLSAPLSKDEREVVIGILDGTIN